MYKVNLEVFQGPLDLLLHLIEKMEIDIYNIPIAHLTESYLEYINNNPEFSLENAEEYIVMAATLLHMKSKSLLPKSIDEGEDYYEEDLVQQLIDYKNYKELSEKLEELRLRRTAYLEKESEDMSVNAELGVAKMSSEKLLFAMENVLKSFEEEAKEDRSIVTYRREVSFEEVKVDLVKKFRKSKKLSFSNLVKDYKQKNEVVVVFISLLTMIKDQELLCFSDEDDNIILEYKGLEDVVR